MAERTAFVSQEVGDDAADAAADALDVEASADDTGAGEPLDGTGPAPEGANPLPPDPQSSVLPEPEVRVGEVTPITAPEQMPSDLDPDVELDDEVVARRTERSKTFVNGDGTFTTETSIEPMHVESRGGWEEIDTDLREGVDGEIVNGAAPVDITLGEDGADAELAVVGLDEGRSVAYGLEGADDVEPELDGATATYVDILPGVDLELESTPGGLKETAILASPAAQSELVFTLDLEGLTAEVEPTGGVALSDDEGEVVAAIPPGFMVDAVGAQSEAVGYALEERGDETVLVVTPDRGWLDHPARAWPVRVDPTTVDRTPFSDTYVKDGSVANRSGALELRAGPEGGANTAAYMKFFLNLPADSFIAAATLYAHNSYSAGGCTPKPVGVYRVTQSWDDATMTGWPGATYSSAAVDVRSFAYGGGASCPSNWGSWDVQTLVDAWVKGNAPNYGITLRVPSQNIGDAGTGKRFTSVEGSTDDAKIRVTWSPWGAQYNPGNDWIGGNDGAAWNNRGGKWPVQVKNIGSQTWPVGSDVKLGARVYTNSSGTGTPVAQSRTELTQPVSPGEVLQLSANVPALPPGNYYVLFEMVKEGDFWFSAEGGVRQGVQVPIFNQVPRFVSNAPDNGDTVSTRQPTLSVVGEDPDDFGFVIDYFFRICPEAPSDFPTADPGCQSSGWQSANSWTPPVPLASWNKPAYWWAFIRDRSGPEPHFAEPVMIVPTPTQGEWSALGASNATASDGGVDVRTGNYSAQVTDLDIGWGSSSFSLTRTYNSIAWTNDSTMGRGWASLLDVRLEGPTSSSRPSSITLFRDDGRRETWARDAVDPAAGEEVYKGPMGSADTLTWDVDASRFVWRRADRTEYRFNSSGRLTSIARPGFQDIAVTRATAASAEAQTFVVDGTTVSIEWVSGKVASVRTTGPTSDAKWRYTYQGTNLTSVCDPRPSSERGCLAYAYHEFPIGLSGAPYGPLMQASVDGTPSLELDYTVSARPKVTHRRDGEAHQWDYAYSTYACPEAPTSSCKQTTVTQPNPSGVLYSGSLAPEPLVFQFDRGSRLVKRFDERGYASEWQYDALGYPFAEIDENGIARFTWHDEDGHLILLTEAREAGSTPVFAHTMYVYNKAYKRSDPRWSQPSRIYDPRVSHVNDGIARKTEDSTWMTYDAQGRMVWRRSPITADASQGRTEMFAYVASTDPGAGQLRTTTDHAGRVTTNTYDPVGRLATSVTPNGVTTQLTYTAEGRVASRSTLRTGKPTVTTTYEYDEVGQLVRTEGPPVTNVVDAVSRQQIVERVYDRARRLVQETSIGAGAEPDRTTQWTGFDGNGRPIEIVDPLGGTTTTTWSWRGHELDVTGPTGLQVRTRYARTGQVARVTHTDLVEAPGDADIVAAYAYDQAGRLATSVDARGASTSYTYWDDGRPRTTTLTNYMATPTSTPQVRELSDVTYDLAGNPLTEVTRNGTLTTTSTYDLSNALKRTESNGRYTAFDHRADGLVESMTVGDATHADLTQYGYAGPGLTLSYTAQSRGGGELPYIVGFEHDDRGLLTAQIEPNNRRTDYDYDSLGRLVRSTGPAVTVEGYGVAASTVRPVAELGYNTFGEIIQEQAPDETTRTNAYDTLGRVVESRLPGYAPTPGTTLDATTVLTYDDAGRTRTITDQLRGTTTTERLDHRGLVIEVEEPPVSGTGPGGVTSMVRDAAGDVVSTMGPQGQVVQATYDNTGRVTRSREVERYGTPGTFETSYVYNDRFDLVTTTEPGTSPVTSAYNAFGELVSEQTTPAGSGSSIATTYVRDHKGQVVRTSDNLGRAEERSFDQMGLLTQTRTYQGATLLRADDLTYDPNLHLATVSTPGPNPGGARVTTSYQHDALGRLTSLTETGNLTTSYGYDVQGRPVRSTDGNGHATWFAYTPWNDLEKVIDPPTAAHPAAADRTWTSTYEAPGLLATTTAPGGVTATYDHDGLGNVVSVTASGADAGASKTMEWDASRRLVELGTPTGATQLAWDDRGNLLDATGASGTASMRYDAAGRMTSRSDAGASSTFTYWPNGLLKSATGDQTAVAEQYSYDATGAIQTISYGSSGTSRAFTYDGFGNVASDTLKTGTTTLASQTWTFGADGEHVASTTTGPSPLAGSGVEAYTYTGAGRLASTTRGSTTTATTWDAAGNRLTDGTTTATYDERNRLLTSGPPGAVETYSWTARGTLDQTTGPSGTTDYQFDALDRLIREVGGSVDDQYTWDSLGRMASVDGAALSYAGLERDPVAVPGQVFERGPDGTARAFEPAGGAARFIRSNQRDDATATFVPGATTSASSRSYTPHGTATSSGTPQPSIGYQGDWTSGSGLVHMDARFYDPASGAFLSRDTANLGPGRTADTNRYTYGAANPVSVTDPTGHAPEHAGRVVGVGNCKPDIRSLLGRASPDSCDRPPPKPPKEPDHCLGSGCPPNDDGPGGGGCLNCNPPGPGPGPGPGGSSPSGGGSTPTKPKPPPKPVRPSWTHIRPTVPTPPGHLVPAASANRPIVETSVAMYRNPTNVPLSGYNPQDSTRPRLQLVEAGPADTELECGYGNESVPFDGTPTVNDVYQGTVTQQCAPYSDHDKDLYKAFYDEILEWSDHFGISPELLAATLQHEGYGIWQYYRRFGAIARGLENALPVGSVGIGGMEPGTAQDVWEDISGQRESLEDIRGTLVLDDEFAIALAAAHLADLKADYGLSDRQAFQAYAFSPGRVSDMDQQGFHIYTESRNRGRKYDQLLEEMEGVFPE